MTTSKKPAPKRKNVDRDDDQGIVMFTAAERKELDEQKKRIKARVMAKQKKKK